MQVKQQFLAAAARAIASPAAISAWP